MRVGNRYWAADFVPSGHHNLLSCSRTPLTRIRHSCVLKEQCVVLTVESICVMSVDGCWVCQCTLVAAFFERAYRVCYGCTGIDTCVADYIPQCSKDCSASMHIYVHTCMRKHAQARASTGDGLLAKRIRPRHVTTCPDIGDGAPLNVQALVIEHPCSTQLLELGSTDSARWVTGTLAFFDPQQT